jgi:predicted MFS family arabinose efflux permease
LVTIVALLSRAQAGAQILALQPLHGVTFGLYQSAAVLLVREQGGADAPTAAQGLFAAVSSLGSLIGVALSGPILERAGSSVFVVGAGAAALATACGVLFAQRRPRSASP